MFIAHVFILYRMIVKPENTDIFVLKPGVYTKYKRNGALKHFEMNIKV